MPNGTCTGLTWILEKSLPVYANIQTKHFKLKLLSYVPDHFYYKASMLLLSYACIHYVIPVSLAMNIIFFFKKVLKVNVSLTGPPI